MKEITKDSDALICVLYKAYLERRKAGTSKDEAKYFGSSKDIQTAYMPKWTIDDVDDTCRELHRAEYISAKYYDDMADIITLTDQGIIYMENRFKNGVSEVMEYLGKIKGIIPFL